MFLALILQNHTHHVFHAFVRRCHILVKACDAAFQIRHPSAHRVEFFVWIGARSAFLILYPLVLFRNLTVNFRIVRRPVFQHGLQQSSTSLQIKRGIKQIAHLLQTSQWTTYAGQTNKGSTDSMAIATDV